MNKDKLEKFKGLEELLDAVMKLQDFGSPSNLELKKIFFDISENEACDNLVKDMGTDLMLYCEEDEFGVLGTSSKEKILEEMTATFE